MTDNSETHRIFITNPIDLNGYVDSYVDVELENGNVLSGTVYTIDPVSESVILIRREGTKNLSMKIILNHAVKSIQKCSDVPIDQQDINTQDLFSNKYLIDSSLSKNTLQNLKEQLKEWLLKNMIPVVEDGDILEVMTVKIHPPYSIEQCYCSNPIVLSRIQKLIETMPPMASDNNVMS